jgi:Na+/proline symporter
MKDMLPVGAMGLLVAAMMAATMSTVGDNLNFGSQVLVSDIYRRWFVCSASEKHYLLIGKIGMLIILSLAMAVVFNVTIITDVAIVMLQLSAAELPANWAQWWWWRFNGPARVAASFGGAGIFCIVVLGPKLLLWSGFSSAQKLILPWYWQTILVMGLTTLLWIAVALLTKPDPDQLLNNFYQRAKPLGFWKPFRKLNKNVLLKKPELQPIFRGIGIAVIGFAATCLLISGLTEAWFGRYNWAMAELIGAVILFIAFKKTSSAYLDFLSARLEDDPQHINQNT